MRHLVVGTAGHIDHGKSALVEALTGTDPDRLDEEKRRGITIDLGFADLLLDGDRALSFVDVPGHERFVRHMVAGATGIDAVLLVVAADQGVQPQTREHLDICRLLELEHGLVALTKTDLVDPDLASVAALEVRELLGGTFLAQAPIVPVSSRSRAGVDDLRDELGKLFERVRPRPSSGVPRLPVDRAFVLRGFGTVVTGTLVSGTFLEGDEVEVLPSGRRGRIRGLQVHHRKVPQAAAGSRTAINLQGLDCDDVPRGSTVTRPGVLSTTRRVWARLTLLEQAPRSLVSGGPVRFHQGTCEREARFRVLGREENGTLRVEIFLREETVLTPGDRFILRRPAPVDTVGGGSVVDARPPRARGAREADFDALVEGDSPLLSRVDRAGAGGKPVEVLASELGLTRAQVEERAEPLLRSHALVRCGARWFEGLLWRETEERLLTALREFHAAEPLLAGMGREDLRGRVAREMPQEAWRAMLDGLDGRGEIRLAADKVALAGHQVVLSAAERRLSEALDAAFLRGGLEPPDWSTVAGDVDRARAQKLVELLIAGGRLVRIQDGKLFHAAALTELRGKLDEYAKTSRSIDVATFKALAGITRKNAIPLLEHLDAERVTRRVGNAREIL